MRKLNAQYTATRTHLTEPAKSAEALAGVTAAGEANALTERFCLLRKKRSALEYMEIASYLLGNYTPEFAYFIAVELNEQLEPRLGYPPIGQIMKAMELEGSEDAARWIGCSLRNFPKVETAQLAFGVIASPSMRTLVRADLARAGAELSDYICSNSGTPPPVKPAIDSTESSQEANDKVRSRLSDGIERMPRLLTQAERTGDRLFLHLQTVSLVLLFLCPILGAISAGWVGAIAGLAIGWLVRIWMRRSMGLRGSNPDEGFFIRMKERANGSRRGILEFLIEKVRQREFTQCQCKAIAMAWDDTRERLNAATSAGERRALIIALDEKVKRISYNSDC